MNYKILELEVMEVTERSSRFSDVDFLADAESSVPEQHPLAQSSVAHKITHFSS